MLSGVRRIEKIMTLSFNDKDGPMHFEFLFEGFVLGGSIEKVKGLTALRNEIRILDKLESISETYPCDKKLPTGEFARFLSSGEKELEFNNVELEMIQRYMSLVPWTTGQPARNAIKTIDWLETLKDSTDSNVRH